MKRMPNPVPAALKVLFAPIAASTRCAQTHSSLPDFVPTSPARQPTTAARALRILTMLVAWIAWCSTGASRLEAADDKAAPAPKDAFMRVGISRSIYRNTNYNDASAAYRIFLQGIAARAGYNTDFEINVWDDRDAFSDALQDPDKPVHLTVIMAWDFLQMKKPETLRPLFVVAEEGSPGRRYCLLTHRASGLNQLADLRGKSLHNFDIRPGTQGWQWLDIILDEAGLPAATTLFGDHRETTKASTTVLPVFFRTTDACLIDEPSLDLLGELNPQVTRDLQVLARSDFLADVVICVSDTGWNDEKYRMDTIDALGRLNESTEGRQLLTLFKISSLQPYEPRHLNASRDLLDRLRRSENRSAP